MAYQQAVNNIVDITLRIFAKYVESTGMVRKFIKKTTHNPVDQGANGWFTFVDNVNNLWKT
jgi:hypothetical protein